MMAGSSRLLNTLRKSAAPLSQLRSMLATGTLQQHLLLLRQRSCCATLPEGGAAAAGGAAGELACEPAQPGTVPLYELHLMLRPTDATSTNSFSSWPPMIEREAPFVDAFRSVAQLRLSHADAGAVKISAFQDDYVDGDSSDESGVRSSGSSSSSGNSAGSAGLLDVLVYPDGAKYRGLRPTDLAPLLQLHLVAEPPPREALRRLVQRQEDLEGLQLFVCCHGSRDARCGARGPSVVDALRKGAQGLGLGPRSVRVFPVSHIGGHKYAGNVLVYGAISPCDGDWFGGVSPENAERFLHSLVHTELDGNGGPHDPSLRPYWRGRMGLDPEEQLELFEAGGMPLEHGSDADEDEDEDEGEFEGASDAELEEGEWSDGWQSDEDEEPAADANAAVAAEEEQRGPRDKLRLSAAPRGS